MALLFATNDMDSLMIEENVESPAGTVHHLTVDCIRRCIENVGYIPRQRNVFYDCIDRAAEYQPQQLAPALTILQSKTFGTSLTGSVTARQMW